MLKDVCGIPKSIINMENERSLKMTRIERRKWNWRAWYTYKQKVPLKSKLKQDELLI